MKVRAHIYISGLVQGVFFRDETRKAANRLSVTGWVRNLPDGRVEALFEGEREDVQKMIEFCKRGPPRADVEDTEVVWETWQGESQNFHIAY